MTFIIGCSNAENLCRKAARLANVKLARSETKIFPDGDLYVRVDGNLEGEKVLLVQSGYPNQNSALMELFLALDAVKDMDPKRVSVMLAYMPYSKQDRRFKGGEAVSAGTVLKLIKGLGADRFYAINLHFAGGRADFHFFNVGVRNLNAAPLVADYVGSKYGDFTAVLPGKGSNYLLTDNVIPLETRRQEYRASGGRYFGGSGILGKDIDVGGKTVLVLDDIVSTGGTMAKACDMMRRKGAKRVISACIHGLFVDGAVKKLENAGADEIISTDTIESGFSKVSVAPLIAGVVKKI
ncbi:MAG: ribose-phosphate diphosphokinase [Candidatus Aenigmarchaeota archaeon]|nr:ribose-phosphate diphosphokinase [Candidatus Aenigmarchaeota archaeon]